MFLSYQTTMLLESLRYAASAVLRASRSAGAKMSTAFGQFELCPQIQVGESPNNIHHLSPEKGVQSFLPESGPI
jgi:hypothetical protein